MKTFNDLKHYLQEAELLYTRPANPRTAQATYHTVTEDICYVCGEWSSSIRESKTDPSWGGVCRSCRQAYHVVDI